MSKEELNQANWAANRVAALTEMGRQLAAHHDDDDYKRRFNLGAEFDKDGMLVPKFRLPEGVGRNQEMGANTTFMDFKMVQQHVDRYVQRCSAENDRKKLSVDAWASLTREQRSAICEFPPAELTDASCDWDTSSC